MDSPTYAGALPKAMLAHEGSARSRHPNCSFVGIGARAREILEGHGPASGAYEPVRRMIELDGKGLLIGCVEASPGFTTAHLAEADLGLFRRVIFPWLNSVFFVDEDDKVKLFKRQDHGLCSQGFRNFYSHYVLKGILRSGFVGHAYSIAVPLREAYEIERALLARDPKFAICGNPDCVMCNARRWDRLHRVPVWALRRLRRTVAKKPGAN
jgi:aminoglycoside N3'-acetyltransferase